MYIRESKHIVEEYFMIEQLLNDGWKVKGLSSAPTRYTTTVRVNIRRNDETKMVTMKYSDYLRFDQLSRQVA